MAYRPLLQLQMVERTYSRNFSGRPTVYVAPTLTLTKGQVSKDCVIADTRNPDLGITICLYYYVVRLL